jgi:tripartite ATP-independent transporter DctM subunit
MIILVCFAALFALMFTGTPIAFAMVIVGFAGFASFTSVEASLAMVGQIVFDTVHSYELTVLPLFILMGNFVTRSKMSDDLYLASNAFLGHRRGGLAVATIAACGGFAAVSGSSLATVATMAKVAMPQMRRYGYSPSLSAGSVAAGGTLGILIPPSVVLILYGLMTENNIGALFAAGLLPGILGIVLYILAVRIVVWRDPAAGPPGPRVPWKERMQALSRTSMIVVLFVIVLGGIYGGVFTPTEAAGIGASGAFMISLIRRSLTWRVLYDTLVESGRTSAMLFAILIGAMVFANFINIARFPSLLSDFVGALGLSPLMIIFALTVIYFVLGCVLESMSMLVLTVPVFYPLILAAGIDPVWFGIYVVVVIEIGLITPPMGLNAFVLKAAVPEVNLGQIFRGLVPFVAMDFVRIALLTIFPSIALFLPRLFG